MVFLTTPNGTLNIFYPLANIQKNYGKSQFLLGTLTISMAIFNSYVSLPEGIRNNMKQ